MKATKLRATLLAAALALGSLASSAHALTFVFQDVSANGGMSMALLDTFQAASDHGSSMLTDNASRDNMQFGLASANATALAFEVSTHAAVPDGNTGYANDFDHARTDGSPYFSVDGGATAIEPFSTGATARGLKAFDAAGWDLATAMPEPDTYAVLLAGLAVAGSIARRRS